uniref:CCHC-type domain-containing protein n=1 Tax=Ananas comosus var. bracteatus TaxID=296719 RepID=A0A6V7NPN0_ANACO|nr:unnamed protein product [Ananas comosus var. bracteatus]
MPDQAEPSARPEASAPPDLIEQLAALTEVIKQQSVLLQQIYEIITQWSGVETGASVQQALLVGHGVTPVQERTMAPGQSQDRKRPFPDDGGQASSRRPLRLSRSCSQGRGSSGRQHSRGLLQQGPSPRTLRCVICGGPHWPRQCEQKEGRCYTCGQPGHVRATGFGYCAFRGSGSRQGRREVEPYPTDRARGTPLLQTRSIDIVATMNSSVDYSDDIEQQHSDCEDLTELSKKLERLAASNEKEKQRIEQLRAENEKMQESSSKLEVVTNVCLTAAVVGAMVKKKRGSGISEAAKNVAKSL